MNAILHTLSHSHGLEGDSPGLEDGTNRVVTDWAAVSDCAPSQWHSKGCVCGRWLWFSGNVSYMSLLKHIEFNTEFSNFIYLATLEPL